MARAKVAVIGTGGTISSLGADPFDLQDYVRHGRMNNAAEMLAHFPELSDLADLVPVAFPPIPSTAMGFGRWKELILLIDEVVAAHDDLSGIVILHGTASLEETAYALSLTAPPDVTIVLTGAQRPATGLSTDGAMNMASAIRVASSPAVRGLGVLVVFNEEIHAPREVTKTATWRLQTFQTPDFGALGHADADTVAIYRRPVRAPKPLCDLRELDALPRVDIAYSHADGDGTAIQAFVAAGAAGIVSAGFAPGMHTPAELDALGAAVEAGVLLVQSSRAGSGRVVALSRLVEAGIIPADNLNPQKARILLALALSRTRNPAEVGAIFAAY